MATVSTVDRESCVVWVAFVGVDSELSDMLDKYGVAHIMDVHPGRVGFTYQMSASSHLFNDFCRSCAMVASILTARHGLSLEDRKTFAKAFVAVLEGQSQIKAIA